MDMDSNNSSPTAQVPFIYSLTLASIVKFEVLEFFFVFEYLVNGERYSKNYYCHQIRSRVFASAGATANVVRRDLDLHF